MLKLLALGSAILAMAASSRGISVVGNRLALGGKPLPENTLHLVETDAGHTLASSRVVEPLASELQLTVENGRQIVLEPGVRATLLDDGALRLSSHDHRPLVLKSADREIRVGNPVVLIANVGGWTLGASTLTDGPVRVALAAASDPGAPSDPATAGEEEPPIAKSEVAPPKRPARMRRVLVEEPLWTKIDGETIRRLQAVSPAGF